MWVWRLWAGNLMSRSKNCALGEESAFPDAESARNRRPSGMKRRPWLKWVDQVLSVLFAVDPRERPPRGRALVVRLDHIGDFIMSVPAVRYLKEKAGFCQVDVLVGSWVGDLAREIPAIDDVLVYDAPWWIKARGGAWGQYFGAWRTLMATRRRIRERHYDYIVDLRGDLRHVLALMNGSGAYTVASSRTGGIRLVHSAVSVPDGIRTVPREALQVVEAAFPSDGGGEEYLVPAGTIRRNPKGICVGIHLGARVALKEWPYERYTVLALLIRKRWPVSRFVLFAGPDRGAVFQEILSVFQSLGLDVSGYFAESWATVIAALTECAVVIGPDTALGHLAGLLGVPTVTLFGPAQPERFLPLGPMSRWVYVQQPCSPCLQVHCPNQTADNVPVCMDSITVQSVAEIVNQVVQQTQEGAS